MLQKTGDFKLTKKVILPISYKMNSPFFVFSFTNLGAAPIFVKIFYTFRGLPPFFQNFDSGLPQDLFKKKQGGKSILHLYVLNVFHLEP